MHNLDRHSAQCGACMNIHISGLIYDCMEY